MSDERRAVSLALRGARRARGLRALGVIIVIALSAVVPFACGVDSDRSPPPPVEGTTGSSAGDDASADVGEDRPEGDASTGNLCACAAGIFAGGDATCAACIKSVSAAGQACEGARVACGADLACEAIVVCIARCTREGGAPEGCVSGCAEPLGRDAAHRAYAALLGCACPRCPVCAASSPVACDFAPGDAGGEADSDADAGYDAGVMDARDSGEGDASKGSATDASSPGDGGERDAGG
jgi:hypothetical protein